jgi:hypothetical protein
MNCTGDEIFAAKIARSGYLRFQARGVMCSDFDVLRYHFNVEYAWKPDYMDTDVVATSPPLFSAGLMITMTVCILFPLCVH